MVDLKQAQKDIANFCYTVEKPMCTYKVFCAGGYNSQKINEQLFNYILDKTKTLINQITLSILKFCKANPKGIDHTFDKYVEAGLNTYKITEKVFNATVEKIQRVLSSKSSNTEPKQTPETNPSVPVQTKSTLKIIDGFMVDTKSGFIPTVSYVSKRYKEFNKKYFEDKLPIIPIRIADTKGSAGMVRFCWRGNQVTLKEFCISQKYGYPEEVVCNTILHELIHVYQYAILNERHRGNTDAHGVSFIKEMKRINAFGWKVNTHVTTEEHKMGILTDKEKSKLKNFRFYAFIKSNKICMGKIRTTNAGRLRSPTLGWFEADNPKSSIFVDIPESRGGYSYSGHPFTYDEVKKLLADKEIRILSLPDEFKKKLGIIDKVRESIDQEPDILYDDGDYRIVIENGERILEIS